METQQYVHFVVVVVVGGVDVAVNSMKMFIVTMDTQQFVCRAIKYFLVLLAKIKLQYYQCESVLLPWSASIHIAYFLRRIML
jgi:hypothetical protein